MTLEPGRLLVLMLLHSCGVYFTMFRQAHQRHILSWAPGFHLGQMLCLRKQSLKCLRKPFLVQELGPILPVVVGGGGPWSPRPCALAASESEGSAPVTEAGVTGTGRIGKLSPPAKTHTAWARPAAAKAASLGLARFLAFWEAEALFKAHLRLYCFSTYQTVHK